MLTKNTELLSFRATAILPMILFTPTLVLGIVAPGSKVGSSLGIVFHLSMLFIVSRMPAPDWARAAGFGWLTLDVLCGAMLINAVPYEIAWPVRLGGHVLGGVWLITASILCGSKMARFLGVFTGLWLGLYTFVGTVLPPVYLAPPGILMIVWLGLLAWKYEKAPGNEAAAAATLPV